MEVGESPVSVTLVWPYFTVLSHILESRRVEIGLLVGLQPPTFLMLEIKERSCRQHGVSKDPVFMGGETKMRGGSGEKRGCKLADMSVNFNSATAA